MPNERGPSGYRQWATARVAPTSAAEPTCRGRPRGVPRRSNRGHRGTGNGRPQGSPLRAPRNRLVGDALVASRAERTRPSGYRQWATARVAPTSAAEPTCRGRPRGVPRRSNRGHRGTGNGRPQGSPLRAPRNRLVGDALVASHADRTEAIGVPAMGDRKGRPYERRGTDL